MIIEHLTVGPFQTNVYVVGCPETRVGVIIDAGGDGPGLLRIADEHELTLDKILQTHAHIDHVAALNDVLAQRDLPIHLHPHEQLYYDSAPEQASMFGLSVAALPPVTDHLHEGQVIEVGAMRAEVLLMPGHSPGSVVFYFAEQATMISGDVLFRGSIGRVDLPGSDPQQMRESLARLKKYPANTNVFPGHGPPTTLAEELQTNPFLTQSW
ncbi:MAG: MBL fold metallo-hydrolase [Myxococcota bacterium]